MNIKNALLCVPFLLGANLLLADVALAKKVPAPAMAKPSEAVTPVILEAVSAELDRAMKKMRIPGAPAPYFISYKLTQVDVHDVVASLGSVTDKETRDFVSLEAHVHVGSYEKDNSNFIAQRQEDLDGIATVPLPLEASAERARRATWLATDVAYKEAIAQWQDKNEAIASGAQGGSAPSYTPGKPIVMKKPVAVRDLASTEELAARATAISAVFRDHEGIRDSRVAFTSFLENRWYLNSEGTNATDTRRVEGVIIVATAQAPDGQEVAMYFSRYDNAGESLPSNAELKNSAAAMADKLKALSSAPLVDAYTGPVLFEGEGAVDLVRHTLAPHLSGTPPPVGVSSTDALLAGKLAGRIGLKVISDLLSVVDDPSTSTIDKRFVIGGYKFDDEGVAPKRVQVLKDGKLVELLMSRTPSKDQPESNGHARLSMPGGVFRGSATNLIVTGKKAQSQSQLRKKLLAEAKAQGLPYAIIIRQFDDPAITSNTEMSRLAMLPVLQSLNPQSPPHATLAYRLYPDGREELVRGVQLAPVDMRAWRDVIAVGKGSTLQNFLATTDDPFLQRLTGVGAGRVPSGGIESSVSTPDLLFKELELKATKYGMRMLSLLPPPAL